jgi:ADP-heptose:LPS heptosyltransferase
MKEKIPKKILIVKFGAIGDVIFLTPMMNLLRCRFPASDITFVTMKWVGGFQSCLPMIDSVIASDVPYERSILKKIFGTLQLCIKIRSLHPDVCIVAHRNSFFGLLARISGAPQRIGFEGTKYLTHTVPFQSSLHEVDRYCRLLTTLGIDAAGTVPSIFVPADAEEKTDAILRGYGITPESSVMAIFPGGGENQGTTMLIKRWGKEKFRETIRILLEEYGMPIVLIGGRSDRALCNEVAEGFSSVFNFAGELSLCEVAALGKRCRLFVGGDSGPTHLAAAAGAPTVMLFGPSDPRLVAPKGSADRILWKQPQCAPCYTPESVQDRKNFNGNVFFCRTGTVECMKSISVSEVVQEIENLLTI